MKKKVISMSLWCQNTPINKGCTFQTQICTAWEH